MLVPPLEMTPEEVRASLRPLRHKISIALDSFGNGFGVGACIRIAHSFLVSEIYIIGTEPYYEKASMGMHKYETIVRVPTAEAFLKACGMRPILALEKECATRTLYDPAPFPENAVFVFGSERQGLSPVILSAAKEVLAIPMYGVNHSLPVVATVAMTLSEWSRRNLLNQ
jgi:tRNA G18 (ribose-2'-O)-methylase SpoU